MVALCSNTLQTYKIHTHSLAHTPKYIRLFPFDVVVVVCSSRYFLSIWLFCCEFYCPSHSLALCCVCTHRKCASKVYSLLSIFSPFLFRTHSSRFDVSIFPLWFRCSSLFPWCSCHSSFRERNTKLRLVWLRKLYINYNKNNIPTCAVCNCINIYQSSITRQALSCLLAWLSFVFLVFVHYAAFAAVGCFCCYFGCCCFFSTFLLPLIRC